MTADRCWTAGELAEALALLPAETAIRVPHPTSTGRDWAPVTDVEVRMNREDIEIRPVAYLGAT